MKKKLLYFYEKAASSWLVSVYKSYLLIWVNKIYYKYEKIKFKKTLVTLSHLTWIPLIIVYKSVFILFCWYKNISDQLFPLSVIIII